VRLDSLAGRREIPCEILKETPHRSLVRLGESLCIAQRPPSGKGRASVCAERCCGAGCRAVAGSNDRGACMKSVLAVVVIAAVVTGFVSRAKAEGKKMHSGENRCGASESN
jgi:hypothetical protein